MTNYLLTQKHEEIGKVISEYDGLCISKYKDGYSKVITSASLFVRSLFALRAKKLRILCFLIVI